MRFRRVACFLLGAWFAGSLFTVFSAWERSEATNRLLAAPVTPATASVASLGEQRAAAIIRYVSAEQARFSAEIWEDAQIVLAIVLAVLLLLDRRTRRLAIGAACLFLLVLTQRITLTPQLTALDRIVDFVPWAVKAGIRSELGVLQIAYIAVEVAKFLGTMFMAWILFTMRVERHPASREHAPLRVSLHRS